MGMVRAAPQESPCPQQGTPHTAMQGEANAMSLPRPVVPDGLPRKITLL